MELTRRQHIFLHLAVLFAFALYLAVPGFRYWVPLWLPVLALLGLELLFFWSGYRSAGTGAPAALPTKRLPGLEDADLLDPAYRRALLRRELDEDARVGVDVDEDEDEELVAEAEEWEALLPAEEPRPPEPVFSGWRIGRLQVPAWGVEAAGLLFVAAWIALPAVRDAVPAVLAFLVGALSLAGAVSGLLVSGVPAGLRGFGYRHPRVVRLAEVTAVLLAATGIVVALVRPQGWDAVPSDERARAERTFSAAASAIAGKPVVVRCDTDYLATGHTHDASGVAIVGGTRALLEPDVCHALLRLAADGKVLSRERTSRALVVLAHEAWHLRGVRNESTTECYALQSGVAVGARFGLSEEQAREFMRYRLALNAADYRNAPAYVVGPECRDGGALDLHPRSRAFP